MRQQTRGLWSWPGTNEYHTHTHAFLPWILIHTLHLPHSLTPLSLPPFLSCRIDDERYACVIREDERFAFRIELVRRAAVRAANDLWARAEQLWAHMEHSNLVRFDAEVRSVKKLTKLVHYAVEAEERCVPCTRAQQHARLALF